MIGLGFLQQTAASATLDAEFSQLDPGLVATITQVQKSLTDGLTPGQVMMIAAGVPIAMKVLQIVSTYTDTHNQRLRANMGATKTKVEMTTDQAAAFKQWQASQGGKG